MHTTRLIENTLRSLIKRNLEFNSSYGGMALRVSTEIDLQNPNKEPLQTDILAMREPGMSYRRIGAAHGIYWTLDGYPIK